MKRFILLPLTVLLLCAQSYLPHRRKAFSAWTPETPGTLSKWFDADNISGADTDPVATWPNSSSVSGDATASGGAQPTLQTVEVNGHNAVDFDGTSDWMSIASGSAMTTDSTAFVVLRRNAGTQMSLLAKDSGAASAGAYYFYLDSVSKPTLDRPYVEGGVSATAEVTVSTWVVITVRVSGTTVYHYLNGAANGTDTITTGTATGVDARIGALNVGGGPIIFFNGMMANILIYTSSLSTTSQQAVEDYLGERYGITITH